MQHNQHIKTTQSYAIKQYGSLHKARLAVHDAMSRDESLSTLYTNLLIAETDAQLLKMACTDTAMQQCELDAINPPVPPFIKH